MRWPAGSSRCCSATASFRTSSPSSGWTSCPKKTAPPSCGPAKSSASSPSRSSWPRSSPGIKGVYTPIAETVDSFEALVNGDLDDLPEQAFLNVGGAESAKAKARELEKGA